MTDTTASNTTPETTSPSAATAASIPASLIPPAFGSAATPAVEQLLAELRERRPLAGRVAVVTGATSGIGEATARQFAAAGASVALVGRRADRLETLAAEFEGAGTAALALSADLSVEGAAAGLSAQVREQLGRVDLVVANAGVMLPAPFTTSDQREWGRMLDLNLRGLLETGQAFSEDLLAAGAEGRPADLVHIGSVGGHMVFPTYAVYCATKAAVAHFTRNLRAEFGPLGVRVRNVEPGFTETELGEHMSGADNQAALADMIADIGRISPHEIASAIVYSSGAPAHVNVAEMVVVPTKQG